MKNLAILYIVILPLIAGCVDSNLKRAINNDPNVTSLRSASDFIIRLKENGKLPGINSEEHCSMQSGPYKINVKCNGNLPAGDNKEQCSMPSPPFKESQVTELNRLKAITFRVTVKEKRKMEFWYSVSKADSNEKWMLLAAWKIDESDGVTLDLLSK